MSNALIDADQERAPVGGRFRVRIEESAQAEDDDLPADD
jgi:hypothetical protein